MITIGTDWMVYFNGILLIWLLFEIYRGYKRGLLLQLVDLASSVVAAFTAWLIAPSFQKIYAFVAVDGNGYVTINQLIGQHINRLIWFVILFIIIRLLLLLVMPVATLISKMPLIKQVNSAVGGVFSVVFFMLKLLLVIFVLSTPIIKNGQAVVANTWLKYVEPITQPVMAKINESITRNEAIQTIIDKKELPKEQQDALTIWLMENGFKEAEVEEFVRRNG